MEKVRLTPYELEAIKKTAKEVYWKRKDAQRR